MVDARGFALVVSAFIVCACQKPADPPASPSAYRGAFVDHFKTLDEDKGWFVSDGWSNGDWVANDFRRSAVRLTRDGLALSLSRNGWFAKKPFAGGEIQSRSLYQFGYFEARLKAAKGSGVVTGLFTFTRKGDEKSWDEIDVEILGRDTSKVDLTYYSSGVKVRRTIDLPFDAAEDFHSFAFEWKPSLITWFVDGAAVLTMDGSAAPIPQRPQKFIIDLWNSTNLEGWVGPLDRSKAPWRVDISCMAQAPTYTGEPLCVDDANL